MSRDAAQPSRKRGLDRIECADAAHSDEPGFLDDFIRVIAQAGTAPKDIGIQTGKGVIVEDAPRLLIAGQNGVAEAPFAPDAIRRVHGGPRSLRSYCCEAAKSFAAMTENLSQRHKD